jgi:ribosomal protein L11 methyltransferase
MLRIVLRLPADEAEAVTDRLLPLLPMGITERALPNGQAEIAIVGPEAALGSREQVERLAGRRAHSVQQVPADWRARQAIVGGGRVVAGTLVIRSPRDPPGPPGLREVVIERGAASFGTGTHPTTRMCLELLAGLDVAGSALDVGCGTGVLAITAAQLGWSPVTALDRDAEAVGHARANAQRNGVTVECLVLDVTKEDVPAAALVLANAPPAVHARLAGGLGAETRHVIASGIADGEAPTVMERYAAGGFAVIAERSEGGWTAIHLTREPT